MSVKGTSTSLILAGMFFLRDFFPNSYRTKHGQVVAQKSMTQDSEGILDAEMTLIRRIDPPKFLLPFKQA